MMDENYLVIMDVEDADDVRDRIRAGELGLERVFAAIDAAAVADVYSELHDLEEPE